MADMGWKMSLIKYYILEPIFFVACFFSSSFRSYEGLQLRGDHVAQEQPSEYRVTHTRCELFPHLLTCFVERMLFLRLKHGQEPLTWAETH